MIRIKGENTIGESGVSNIMYRPFIRSDSLSSLRRNKKDEEYE